MRISISTTFVDPDAFALASAIVDETIFGRLRGMHVAALMCTREKGDNPVTDTMLEAWQRRYPNIPLVTHSAKQHGRLVRNPGDEIKDAYDRILLEKLARQGGAGLNVMVGDMIVKGPDFCRELPSFNLHPDLPLGLRGFEGIYWEVIGKWVRHRRLEIGGMMHLAIPTLDAGTPVSYFRLPAYGTVRGVHLGPLWDKLPQDPEMLETLIQEQVGLRDQPTDPLFQELRRAEASYEPNFVVSTLQMIHMGHLRIDEREVYNWHGERLTHGLDLTTGVVGETAVWPGQEGVRGMRKEAM